MELAEHRQQTFFCKWLTSGMKRLTISAFDLINHCLLIEKLQLYDLPEHIIRWMAAFLLDRNQRVKIGNHYSQSGLPNGGVPQGTLSGPKCFLVYINDLETPVHLYKYVDDSTLF